jgi:hypothetical protein
MREASKTIMDAMDVKSKVEEKRAVEKAVAHVERIRK